MLPPSLTIDSLHSTHSDGMRLLKISTLTIVLLGLGACASTPSQTSSGPVYRDYKSSSSAPRLDIPPDLTGIGSESSYALPGDASAQNAGKPAPAANSNVLVQPDGIKLLREGSVRWLEVNLPADKLWKQLTHFWQSNGLKIGKEEAKIGLMETEWAVRHPKIDDGAIRNALASGLGTLYASGWRDKYITRLDTGSTPGTTLVFISHMGMEEIYTMQGNNDTRWQARPADPGLESDMLRRLMVQLGASEEKAQDAVSLTQKAAVANLEQSQFAKMATGSSGDQVIVLAEAYDRAWRHVGQALDRGGFTVEDRDRAQGNYFVRYIDPEVAKEKDKGFFASLAFWRDPPPAVDKAQRRIYLKSLQDSTEVKVQSADGKPDNSETAKKILTLLLKQLK